MQHIIEVTTKYVWHDLMEDPNDLPTDPVQYLVLTRNRTTDELEPYFCMDYDRHGAIYRPEAKVWVCTEDDGSGWYNECAFGSYGLEHSAELERDYGEDFSDWEVVAWMEETGPGPEIYTPAHWAKRKDDEQ